MARCMGDVEREQALLDVEGGILVNDRGAATLNPRAALLDSLVKRQLAYGRALRLSGRAVGDVRDEAGRRKVERRAAGEEFITDAKGERWSPDGLLAM